MDGAFGRPTQVHSVPLEERAVDSKGNRLPWGLEWHSDHPNARSQKRHLEEKGPFGKSNRRKGSSRTRTVTPAKKENPIIDGFDKALSFSLTHDSPLQQSPAPARLQPDSSVHLHTVSTSKHPTQVLIHGYSSDTQWAALEFYEKSSFGMMCEDYAREPPAGSKRFPSSYDSPRPRRALTKAEKAMVFKYDGGEHWVKVTFDSAEAAERAIEYSPTQIYGHWVYASLYHGVGPESDEAVPVDGTDDKTVARSRRKSLSFSTLTQPSEMQQVGRSPLRSYTTVTDDGALQSIDSSPSSTTATSGTATGAEYQNLNQQTFATPEQALSRRNPHMMKHFPDVPRTVLRPASEAFLPQPTWWERQAKWMSEMGLIPGEIIGDGIPIGEDGKVDLGRASFYWRFFYWLDCLLGTDFCGLKDDD